MKTILVPTDFSLVSRNSIDYASEIAKLSHAKIILFHAYQIPLVNAEVPVPMLSLDEMEKLAIKELEKIKTNISAKYGKEIDIECKCQCGFAVDEINLFAKENKVDLIVMGMHGSGYLFEKLIGSTTTALMNKSTCPVLAIHQNVKFKSIKKIALASDYKELHSQSVLNPLKQWLNLFKAHLFVFNVVPELGMVHTIDTVSEKIKLKDTFHNVEHSFHKTENTELIEGINDFIAQQKIDMLVMIPRQHSWFGSLFHASSTKKMAFHAHIPLLVLHE